MRRSHPRRAAAACALAACALLALNACTSSSADDAPHKPAKADRAHKPAKADNGATTAIAPDGATYGKAVSKADLPLLTPLVPAAARTFDPATGAAGNVHTVRIRQEQWSGDLRTDVMRGVVDWGGSGRVELAIDVTGETGDEATDEAAGTLRARVLGGTMYVYLGAKAEKGAGGRHWMKGSEADMADLGDFSAARFSPVRQLGNVLALPTTEKVGTETFQGVRAAHYRSTLDEPSLEAAAAAKGSSGTTVARLRDSLRSAGLTSEVVDVWVSPDGLPLSVNVEDTGMAGTTTQLTTYSDYGLAVAVEAPPAFDTVGSDELDGS